ncbi:MAG TPA: hypothetical protein VK515_05655, partial [Rhizomicrobium sp.]|nr:hypothetical protein [Rhizomicrobium sp.]
MSNIPPDLARSPVFDGGARIHPGLVRPGSSWGMGFGVVGACVLGVITFVSLSNHRTAPPPPAPAPAAPAPVKPAPVAVAPPAPIVIQAPAPQVVAQVAPAPDTHAPTMVVDFSQAPAAGVTATTVAAGAGTATAAADDKLSPDERFSAKVGNSNVDVAHSSRLHDLSH